MITASLRRTRRTLLSFTIILFFFLIIVDGLVIAQQAKMVRSQLLFHTQHEFELFSKLVVVSLTRGDYVSVQEAVLQWGKEQETLVELSIHTENGFSIASYKREQPVGETESVQSQFTYGDNHLATIVMVRDTSEITQDIHELAYQLILFSLVLVTILGITLQVIAVRPLEREIYEHERTEAKLHEQAKALRDSNKELESYSYSIAHDLRTPLRSIVSFCQIIESEAGHKLNAEEQEYFERVVTASKRMAELIDDILDLGRVTRSEMEYTEVDLTGLAKAAVEKNCPVTVAGSGVNGVDYQIQDNLVALGDKRLLALLVDNLVGNACKYTRMKPSAHIEFGSTWTKLNGTEKLTYFIRDNGVGFDMKYAENLFKPFHRLHNESEFEGNGVGLATVQRIVYRHGGEIWAEAETGKGACFYFTLAENEQNRSNGRV